MILMKLFACFFQIGLFSVGGGYAAMPLIEAQTVDAFGWLSAQEFTSLVTIAEMTPGPIAVNAATFVGTRLAGLPGAVFATLGCIFPSLIIVTLVSIVYEKYRSLDTMQAVLSCLRPAVVALIASAALTILRVALLGGGALRLENLRPLGVVLFVAALFALRRLHMSPIVVMLLCGVAGVAVHAIGLL